MRGRRGRFCSPRGFPARLFIGIMAYPGGPFPIRHKSVESKSQSHAPFLSMDWSSFLAGFVSGGLGLRLIDYCIAFARERREQKDRKLSHEKDKPRFRIELAIVPTAHSSVPAAVVKILSLGSLPITINQGRYLSKRLTTQSMYSLQNSMEQKSNSFVVVGCACAGVADFALVAVNGRDVRPAPVVGSRLM